jgi:hypothetical protein
MKIGEKSEIDEFRIEYLCKKKCPIEEFHEREKLW